MTGILDWYTVLVALTATAALALHGASWLGWKTDGELRARAQSLARSAWWLVIALVLITTAASSLVQPRLLENLARFPLGLVCPLLALAGATASRLFVVRAPARAFFGSAALIAGLILSAALAIFPHALPARVAGRELALAEAAAAPSTLRAMFLWWLPGMIFASSYSFLIYRRMPRTFRPGGEH